MTSDGESLGLDWRPLGMSFPSQLGDVLYGYVFAPAPMMDAAGGARGPTIPAGSRVTVLAAGPWIASDTSSVRRYRVSWDPESAQGWIDGSSPALITAEEGTLAAGIVPRRIVVNGGDSDYSLLAIVDRGATTLIDTSSFPFPEAFHPSGVPQVSIADVNGNGTPKVVVHGETIASLRTLGTTSLQWMAWLRPRDGQRTSILFCDESFATDAGYSYTTTMRSFASAGTSMKDVVRLDTEYVPVSGEREFRTNTVSFYQWTGTAYRKDPLQDLPRRGTVTVPRTALLSSPDGQQRSLPALAQGEEVFVFDRSDAPRSPGQPPTWWYDVVTHAGAEGWVDGSGLALAWIDPMEENRAVFLGEATPP